MACGLVVALAALAAAELLRRLSVPVLAPRRRCGAIVLSPLGFLPLWTIVYSIHEHLKVYLLSSVGVAIGVALVVGFVCRRPAAVRAS